jgi:enediyne biosynthesis protein E4
MPTFWRRGQGRARSFVCSLLVLVLSGCDAGPANPKRYQAPRTGQVMPGDPRSVAGRPHHGLSARAAFFALADTTSSISKEPSPFRFADVRQESGVDFIHVSGMTRQKHYPTAFGSGVAMFDYDGDGWLDLYFGAFSFIPLGSGPRGKNRLYKNEGHGRFRDVTNESGLGFSGCCHGIIAGDIDNDGDTDLFLCNFGSNVLFVNNGDGTFSDISQEAGIDKPNWSSGGALLDYDNDGDLDIYVANYGDWQYPRDARACGNERIPLFCSPWDIRTVRHILYRNNGDLTFTDVTEHAGVGRADGHGFGVVAADLNGDGRIDLYVANDMNPNFLFINKGDGTFEDMTESSGAAFDNRGQALSGMGVDAEDCDGDGRPELFVTNFQNEHIAFYQNISEIAPAQTKGLRTALFRESSAEVGLAADSKPWVGWGCALADFDRDGWPDCFVANGHVDDNRAELAPTMSYAEPPLLFRNIPEGVDTQNTIRRGFRLSTRNAGTYFATRHVARGVAYGDLDNDGDIDIVVSHMDGAPAILRNDTPSDNNWICLKLVGTRSNRDAIGAKVEVVVGGQTITRQRKGGCSMQSTNDPRLLIGLGLMTKIDRVSITWPSGIASTLERPAPKTTYEVIEPRDHDSNASTAPAGDAPR